jgi:intein/homing endonuclease
MQHPELSAETRTLVISRIVDYDELEPEQAARAAIKVIANDFFIFIERNLVIKEKMTKRLVPFAEVLNWEQKALMDEVIDDLVHQRPIRYIILKARQMGMSTLIEALCYWWTSTHRYVTSVIIAHEKNAVNALYKMFRRYYEYSHPHFQPDRKYNTKNELVFDVSDEVKKQYAEEGQTPPGLQSEIKTMVAADGKGRADNINFFHGCLHEKSLVVLADGSSKMIKDVNLDDLVITSSGAVAPVTAKTMTGVKQTYKLNTWMSNQPIIASADHKILTEGGYKKLSDIKSTDWIAKPRYQFNHQTEWSYELPLSHRPQNGGTSRQSSVSFDLNEEFGYLVGYYLAEGHIGKKLGRVTFTYEAAETFCERINKFFPNAPKYIVEGNRKRSVFNSVFMANALNELCGRVANKHVPLFGNNDFFKGIYRGYMDGDGSKTDEQRERAPSVHERIARNINRIGDMQGVHGSLHYAERERYGVPSKPIWINSFCNGKSSKYKFINGQCFVRVRSVAPYEVATTYDLEIDHPDHNFETPSGVVSNSEVAFWDDSADIVSSALQAVPMAPESFVFLESTANGIGGYFYDEWQLAKRGESQFKPLFFAWWAHDGYELPSTAEENGHLDDEEKDLIVLFKENNVPEERWPNKIAWRRRKKKEFRTEPKKFYQEYPSTPEEAFLASGRPVFETKTLQEMEKIALASAQTRAYVCGEVYKNDDPMSLNKFVFREYRRSGEHDPTPFRVWWQPEKNHKYVIGVDVSEGIEIESSKGKEPDYSVVSVIDTSSSSLKTVARWRGYIDPDLLGEVVFNIGMFYNKALVGVEVNNHGISTAAYLKNNFYRNLYMRESQEDEQFQVRTTKFGWQTNKKTKPIMISELQRVIREGAIIDLDIVFIRECMSYVKKDDGSMSAQEGQHDDTVMATAVALQMADWAPYNTEYAKENIHKPIKRNTNASKSTSSAKTSRDALSRRRESRKAHRITRRPR